MLAVAANVVQSGGGRKFTGVGRNARLSSANFRISDPVSRGSVG